MTSGDDTRPGQKKHLQQMTAKLPVLLLAVAMIAACSSNLRDVYGEPPQTSLNGMERQPEGVVVELALRNVNDEALRLKAASMTLSLDDQPLVSGGRDLELTVSARGREVVRLTLPADPAGLERLDALADNQEQRLPWTMEVTLTLAGGGERLARANGWLHRVPGQPNRFR